MYVETAGQDFIFKARDIRIRPHSSPTVQCYTIAIINDSLPEEASKNFSLDISSGTVGVILPPHPVMVYIIDDDHESRVPSSHLSVWLGSVLSVVAILTLTVVCLVGIVLLIKRRGPKG